MKLGVISDTHGLFDTAIPSIFSGVDLIVHAGDIGKIEIINKLESIAPVIAVEGNNDWFSKFPTERVEQIAGRQVLVRHIFGELHQLDESHRSMVERLEPDIVIFGHSHRPYKEMLGQTVLFNPGSAGPRRFSLPRTVGLILIHESGLETDIIPLD